MHGTTVKKKIKKIRNGDLRLSRICWWMCCCICVEDGDRLECASLELNMLW